PPPTSNSLRAAAHRLRDCHGAPARCGCALCRLSTFSLLSSHPRSEFAHQQDMRTRPKNLELGAWWEVGRRTTESRRRRVQSKEPGGSRRPAPRASGVRVPQASPPAAPVVPALTFSRSYFLTA